MSGQRIVARVYLENSGFDVDALIEQGIAFQDEHSLSMVKIPEVPYGALTLDWLKEHAEPLPPARLEPAPPGRSAAAWQATI